ncbi:hypothetical protein MBLNU457_6320t1 [Dothideomycetes sp. NU457]
MANVNIRRDVADPFYRYKMERLQSKIEGKGNGIKTVIVNLSNVADQLARPPSYLIKYFGFELGAQTNIDPKDDRWIINGAHESTKLQDYLDGFINKFVLCKNCKNPETVVHIKDGNIVLDCKACGQRTNVDLRQKLSSFILKNASVKGKKDKSTKKADRKARKEAERKAAGGESSPAEGSDEQDDNNGDEQDGEDSDAGDALFQRINAEAKELNEPEEEKEIEWSVDTSEAAVKARSMKELTGELKQATLNDEEGEDGEGDASNSYVQLEKWILSQAEEKGGITKVEDVDVYLKAKELHIETKHRTLTVLALTLFDENMIKQIDTRAAMLKRMITSERHEKAFLGGTERFVGLEHPNMTNQVSAILMKYYQNDLVSEETLKAWGSKASKKYVDISTSKKVRKNAEKFIEWLENAESEEDSDEDDDE